MAEDFRCVAVWTQAQGGQWVNGPIDPGPFSQWVAEKFKEGYRVSSLQLVNINGTLKYQGVVLPGAGGEFITPPASEADFAHWYTTYFNQGYHLVTLDVCVRYGKLYYGGTVRSESGAQWFHPASDWTTFSNWATGLFHQGFRLTTFTTCVLFGQVLYSGTMTAGHGTAAQYMTPALPADQFDAWAKAHFDQGLRLTHVNGAVVDGQTVLAGVVSPAQEAQWLSGELTPSEFAAQDQTWFNKGYHATSFSVFDHNDRYGETAERYRISVDSFEIMNTRSRHTDTDFVTASLALQGRPTQTMTRAMGDLNNGLYGLAMAFEPETLNVLQTAVLTYAIVNSGHSDPSVVEKALENAAEGLADKAADLAAQALGTGIGTALGAEIGTAAVPIIGSALGALAGWIVNEVGNLLFANCDGPVAAGVHPLSGGDLYAATKGGQAAHHTDDQPGTDSAHGCGSNSHYAVHWSTVRA